MIHIARKLIGFLDAPSRLHMALLLVPMLITAVLEMVSIGLILPVIQVLLLDQTDSTATRLLLVVLPTVEAEDLATWVAGSFAVFFIVKNLLLLALIYAVNRVVYLKTARFSARMFELYLGRPLVFHFRRNSAEILRDLVTGCSQAFEALRHALLMTLDAMLMVAALALLLLVEPLTTLAAAAVLFAVGLIFYRSTSHVFHRWGELMMVLEGRLIQWINQSLATIRDVKLLHLYGPMTERFAEVAEQRSFYGARSTTTMHIPRLVVETIVVIGFLAVVLALLAVKQSPDEVVATLGLYGMAALRLMPSLNRILTSAAELKERTAYVDGLHADLVEGMVDSDRGAGAGSPLPLEFHRDILLEDIVYAYPDAVHHALHGITVAIGRGQSVGFVGPSGAGKTTLVDIVLGLLRPKSGRLLVDGVDAFTSLEAWQRRIGYVPQQVSLIDDTLRRNIAFGVEDAEVDEERLSQVLRLARIDDVTAGLANGLFTMLGEGGTRLSGGQRQRVAIARALYRDPDVLVFDEATSALDSETEREITTAIETLSGERTVLIIAHRLSTVRNCDKLVFLKEGRVVASGTFGELVASNAEFRRLVEAAGALNEASTTESTAK